MILDTSLYEEVEADKEALGQALGVVILSSLAAGLGSPTQGIGILVAGVILALTSWFIWAYLTYWIGTKILPESQTRSDPKELLRVLGFASAPGLIRILGIFPGIRIPVFIAATIGMIIAMIIAIKQALDYTSTRRAVAVCFIAWFIQVIIFAFIFILMGYPKKV
ncbi:MAG: hypothetical protein J7M03_03975 [Candidatus Desulfofervidaceae bacterium]|nr:hypothetical protein [Candidatus Desulfofervidaceae bacterium]